MKLFNPKAKQEAERAKKNKAKGLHPNAVLLSEMPLRRKTVRHGPDLNDPNYFPDPHDNQHVFTTKPDGGQFPTDAPDIGGWAPPVVDNDGAS